MSDVPLNDLLSIGWKALQPGETEKVNTEAAHQQWEAAMRIARPFLTPEGRDMLETLRGKTVENATWDPEQGANAIHNGFFREGQNSIVRWIEACIRTAQDGPPGGGVVAKRGKRK